jgi:multisubunit Na+/H+ antiporter MnhC subunit
MDSRCKFAALVLTHIIIHFAHQCITACFVMYILDLDLFVVSADALHVRLVVFNWLLD